MTAAGARAELRVRTPRHSLPLPASGPATTHPRPHAARARPYPTPSAATPSAKRSVAASSVRAVAPSGWVSAVCQA